MSLRELWLTVRVSVLLVGRSDEITVWVDHYCLG